MKQLTDDLQDRVIELLVTSLHFTPSHEPNIAIDAQAAILELRALPDVPIATPEVNSMLVEALKDTAQTLAWMQHGKCRGFSDGLLTTQEALDKAREALTAAKQAQPEPVEQPIEALQKLGARLAALLDEDQWVECEALLIQAGAHQ